MHAVLTTDTFEADAAGAGLAEDEIGAMVQWLSTNPQAGAVMQGTGGARKVRFAGKGKGKSGATGRSAITVVTMCLSSSSP